MAYADTLRSSTALMTDVATLIDGVYDSTVIWGGTSGGSANAQTLSPAISIAAYTTGQRFVFKAGYTSTSALTLKVNSLAVVTCLLGESLAPFSSLITLTAGAHYSAIYDGTNFLIFSLLNHGKFTNDADPSRVSLFKSRGTTAGQNTIVQNGDSLGQVDFYGANGTSYTRGAYINATVQGTPGASNDMPTSLCFATSADASGTPAERVRIDPDGKVGIGTTAPNAKVSIKFDTSEDDFAVGRSITGSNYVVSQNIYDKTTALAANVAVESTAGSYPIRRSTSSIKYKTDVVDLDPVYADKLHQFRPVFFKSKCFGDNPQWTHYGFIAEELAEIEPRFVSFGYRPDDYEDYQFIDDKGKEQIAKKLKASAKPEPEGVNYDRIVTFLTSIIQRQEKRIEVLERQISELK